MLPDSLIHATNISGIGSERGMDWGYYKEYFVEVSDKGTGQPARGEGKS